MAATKVHTLRLSSEASEALEALCDGTNKKGQFLSGLVSEYIACRLERERLLERFRQEKVYVKDAVE